MKRNRRSVLGTARNRFSDIDELNNYQLAQALAKTKVKLGSMEQAKFAVIRENLEFMKTITLLKDDHKNCKEEISSLKEKLETNTTLNEQLQQKDVEIGQLRSLLAVTRKSLELEKDAASALVVSLEVEKDAASSLVLSLDDSLDEIDKVLHPKGEQALPPPNTLSPESLQSSFDSGLNSTSNSSGLNSTSNSENSGENKTITNTPAGGAGFFPPNGLTMGPSPTLVPSTLLLPSQLNSPAAQGPSHSIQGHNSTSKSCNGDIIGVKKPQDRPCKSPKTVFVHPMARPPKKHSLKAVPGMIAPSLEAMLPMPFTAIFEEKENIDPFTTPRMPSSHSKAKRLKREILRPKEDVVTETPRIVSTKDEFGCKRQTPSRSAKSAIKSFIEPKLGSKLRRGDNHTDNFSLSYVTDKKKNK